MPTSSKRMAGRREVVTTLRVTLRTEGLVVPHQQNDLLARVSRWL